MDFVVSVTTRPRRPGEADGVDYEFVGEEEFDRLVGDGGFLEWALVHGHRYGTPSGPVEGSLRAGKVVLLEVDVQGGERLMDLYPDGVSVFLLPPGFDVLAERLRGRGTEPEGEVRRRLERAREEMTHAGRYSYVVVNDKVDEAVDKLRSIVVAERCRVSRRAAPGGSGSH